MDEKLEKLLAEDGILQQAIAALKEKEISLLDIFTAESVQVVIQRLAAAAIALRDYYIEQPGDDIEDVDDLIDALAKYFDRKVELPLWAEPFDGMLFKYAIKWAMSWIERQTSTTGLEQVAVYKKQLKENAVA